MNGTVATVTSNLRSFLVHGRLDKVRTIWVDALCIDQKNTIERGSQVQMMGQIYRNASRVLVWLGEAEGGSDQAMDLINRMPHSLGDLDRALNEQRTIPTITDVVWRHVAELLGREYFRRLWVRPVHPHIGEKANLLTRYQDCTGGRIGTSLCCNVRTF
jgi:hypothetical protein